MNKQTDLSFDQYLLLKDVCAISKIGGWEMYLDDMIPIWTKETYKIHEVPINQVISLEKAIKFYHPDDRPIITQALTNLIESSIFFDLELRFITTSKKIIWVRAIGQIDYKNNRKRVYGSFQEITEKVKKAHEEIELLSLFNYSTDLLCTVNKKGYLSHLNFSWQKVLGYELYELESKLIINFIHPEDKAKYIDSFNSIFKKELKLVSTELRFKSKDGSYRWLSVNAKLANDTNSHIYCSIKDVTIKVQERVEFEKLALIAKSTDNLIMLTDTESRIEWVNEAFEKFTGYNLEEIKWKKPSEFLQGVETSKTTIELMRREIRNYRDVNCEIINYKKNGEKYWVNISIQPILNKKNQVEKFFSIQKVITQEKKTKLELKEKVSLLKKTNQELDSFVYRASHDLRAPIASALGLIELACLTNELDTRNKYLDLQRKSLQRLDRFIKDIIDYSKNAKTHINYELIKFNILIEDVYNSLSFLENYNKIEKSFSIKSKALYYSDIYRLKIIFSNLISNCIKYSNYRNKISHIKITIEIDSTLAKITIKDNGVGIEAKYLSSIFKMFYRAVDDNNGSGLGLYIVKETTKKLGGFITVQSEYGIGTEFYLEIPNHLPIWGAAPS